MPRPSHSPNACRFTRHLERSVNVRLHTNAKSANDGPKSCSSIFVVTIVRIVDPCHRANGLARIRIAAANIAIRIINLMTSATTVVQRRLFLAVVFGVRSINVDPGKACGVSSYYEAHVLDLHQWTMAVKTMSIMLLVVVLLLLFVASGRVPPTLMCRRVRNARGDEDGSSVRRVHQKDWWRR
jgi:hypothetical protein